MAPVSAVLAHIPSPLERGLPRRPVHDPHVRGDAAARDRGGGLAHRQAAGSSSAATGISSTASRSGASSRGSSARGSTTTSRAGTRIRRSTTTGTGRSRCGRAASASGAASAFGVARRRLGRQALGQQRDALHGRGRAGAAARAGDRPLGQLVEPGALRQAHDAAVGARDPRQGGREPLPPDLPLRVHLGPPRRALCCSGSTGASRSGGRGSSRSTSATTPSAACSRSCCAPIRRATSSGCG